MTAQQETPRPSMQLDLALCLVLTVSAFFATVLDAPVIVRLPLAAMLALFIPGYALLCVLIVGHGLSVLERVMIGIVSSISVTIVVGLLLAVLGIPIERMSWVYVLTTISIVALVAAWFRRWRNNVEGPRPALARSQWRQTALVVIAVLVAANVVAASRIVASDQLGSPPEQLWLLEGNTSYTADLGMRADGDGGAYRIVVSSGADQLNEFNLSLGPSETWDMQLTFTPDQRTQQIAAHLYEDDNAVAARYVTLQPLPTDAPSATSATGPTEAPHTPPASNAP